MTIGSGAKPKTTPWTTFTKMSDIPEWISNAYSDSYQGPHEGEAGTASAAKSIPTPSVTPALLQSHYRLGSHRPAGESRVAVYPPDDPRQAVEWVNLRVSGIGPITRPERGRLTPASPVGATGASGEASLLARWPEISRRLATG